MNVRLKFRLAFACALLACACLPCRADELRGRVVAVADGDTVTVLDAERLQHRIRLLGIDAPESGQDFGARSKQSLSDHVFGRDVLVVHSKRDRYGRILGKVLVSGRDANLEQLRAGMAWYYRYYERDVPEADRPVYDRAEREARAAHRGLWQDPNPMPPWDFRRGGRRGSEGSGRAPAPESRRGWEDAGAEADRQGETVYVTRTGEKYHRENCQYLRRSKIPMPLKEAKKHYSPCSVCRPPQ